MAAKIEPKRILDVEGIDKLVVVDVVISNERGTQNITVYEGIVEDSAPYFEDQNGRAMTFMIAFSGCFSGEQRNVVSQRAKKEDITWNPDGSITFKEPYGHFYDLSDKRYADKRELFVRSTGLIT